MDLRIATALGFSALMLPEMRRCQPDAGGIASAAW